jgi:hypothetical protein
MPEAKRKFRSIALVIPSVKRGSPISDPTMRSIYLKLRSLGYQETPWQFVFRGQLGGLVLPYPVSGDVSRNEIHIRFYQDRIVAEYEIGRAYLSHFFGPRLIANRAIVSMLEPHLTQLENIELRLLTSRSRLLDDERAMKEWDHHPHLGPERSLTLRSLFTTLVWRTGWRGLAVALPLLVWLASGFNALAVGATTLVAVSAFFLPTKGRP